MRFHATIALLSLAASSSEDEGSSLLQLQGAKSLDGEDCLVKKCQPKGLPQNSPGPVLPVAPPAPLEVGPLPEALTKDKVSTGTKQILENGGECMKGDFKTLKAMGSGAHTIRASVTMPSVMPTANARQWILNLGQIGSGANHWLWSPTNVHKHGDLQFGRWNGGQIKGVSKGVTHDQMMKAASLTTTFDGKTYSFYIDGKLKKTTVISPPLDIETNNLRVGLHGKQPQDEQKKNQKEVDFSGCVTKVEVWDSALTSDEVAGIGEGNHNVVVQPVAPAVKPQVNKQAPKKIKKINKQAPKKIKKINKQAPKKMKKINKQAPKKINKQAPKKIKKINMQAPKKMPVAFETSQSFCGTHISQVGGYCRTTSPKLTKEQCWNPAPNHKMLQFPETVAIQFRDGGCDYYRLDGAAPKDCPAGYQAGRGTDQTGYYMRKKTRHNVHCKIYKKYLRKQPAPPVKPPVKPVSPPGKPPVKPVAPPAKPQVKPAPPVKLPVRLPPSQFNVVPDGCKGFKNVNEDCTNKDLFILKTNTKGFVAPTFKPDQYGSDKIWETVKTQGSDWKGMCVAYVNTGGGTCKTFCESNGKKCVRAMDDAHTQTAGLSKWLKTGGYKPTDCTLLPSLHSRQSQAENGCNQRWGTQMCACN